MNKFLTIALLSSLAFFVVEGAIVYDPVTNSYTNTTSGTKTTVSKTTTGSTSTGSTTTTKTSTGAYAVSGALSKLHTLLETNQEALLERLDGHYNKLTKTLGAGSGAVDAPGRIDILQCMGVLKSTSAPSGMDHVYNQLTDKVSLISTNIHSEIAALEKKMKDNALDEVTKKLEQAILEQKVGSYLSEYTKVIDMFNTLFTDYAKEIDELVKELDEDEQDEFDTYTEKVAAYQKLMTTYDLFLKKVKDAGLSRDPKTHTSLVDLTPFYGYIRSQLLFGWWEQVVAIYPKNPAFANHLKDATSALQKANTTALKESVLGNDLFPLDDMKLLSKSMASLRGAYTDKNDAFSCDAFVTDKSILVSSPELMTVMNKILNVLQKDLSKTLTERSTTYVKDLVSKQKEKLVAVLKDEVDAPLLTSATLNKSDKELQAVRAFLQAAYRRALDTNATDKFFAKLTTVASKIDKAITATKDKAIIKRLEMIKQAVGEFLVK